MLHLSGNYRRSENFSQKIRNVLGVRNVKTPQMAPVSFRDGASAKIINIKYIISYENRKFRYNALSGELLYGATPRR